MLFRSPAKPRPKKAPLPPKNDVYILQLYVAGATARSREAILRVRALCAGSLKDRCKLDVIDIYQQPALARKGQIVATPTLLVVFPAPVRRFIGNLTNIAELMVGLDVGIILKPTR